MEKMSKVEKVQGAFLASAIGDALGWPNELNSGRLNKEINLDDTYKPWRRKNREPFWHVESIKKGEYSDDTQLLLAIARSKLTQDWKDHFFRIEFPFWLDYERGGGRAIKQAAKLAKNGELAWNKPGYRKRYFMAGGNGGAMRIMPHVAKNMDKDISTILGDVIEDVIISHGHPRAILGATCYAYALHYLFLKDDVLSFAELVKILISNRKIWGASPSYDRFSEWLSIAQNESGFNYSDVWNSCYLEMVEMLKYIQSALEQGLMADDKTVLKRLGAYSKVNGAGDIAILAAVYLFSKYVNVPKLAISVPAFSVGIDTDTIASMTGGLIGAFCGTNWIPYEWRCVQDYSYISELAISLCKKSKRVDKIGDYSNEEIFSNPINSLSEQSVETIDGRYSLLKITKYKMYFGQTIYIKTVIPKNLEESAIKPQISKKSIMISTSDIEKVLSDDQFRYITMRKAFKIIMLREQGEDVQSIEKQTKVDKNIVERILGIFLSNSN